MERTYDKDGKKVWCCAFCESHQGQASCPRSLVRQMSKFVRISPRSGANRINSAQETRDNEQNRIEDKEELIALAVYNVDKDTRLACCNPRKSKPLDEVHLTAESPGVSSALTNVQRPTPFAAIFSYKSSSEKRQAVSQESSTTSSNPKNKQKPKVYQQASLVTAISKNSPYALFSESPTECPRVLISRLSSTMQGRQTAAISH